MCGDIAVRRPSWRLGSGANIRLNKSGKEAGSVYVKSIPVRIHY
jgi:hypothetical protein